MKEVKVGIVGLGGRGRGMLKLSSMFDCVKVVAACDIKPENWYTDRNDETPPFSAMADLFPEAKFYKNYDQMLEEADLDVVMVQTGADNHSKFCCKALEKDINVFAEIPTVASLEEADELWKAAQKSKATISIGANPNYQKFTVLLNNFYNKGLLGKPYYMEAEYIHWGLVLCDGALYENGDWRAHLANIRYCTHSLGPLLTILNEDLRYVSAFGTGQHADDYPAIYKRDDMQAAQFRTESGVVVRLLRNGRCRAEIGHHNYRVFGTEGYMERIDRYEKPVIRYNSQKELDTSLKETSGEFMPPAYADNEKAQSSAAHGGMDYAMLDAFYDAIANGKPAPISLKEGLAMTLPGIYAEESIKRGGEVLRMRYPWDDDWSTKI